MEKSMLLLAVLTFSAQATIYECEGPKRTVLESFKIRQISLTQLDTELDGGLDGVSESNKKMLEYTYNNGCDNDVTFRIHKDVPEYRPYRFNMRVDYYGPDDHLTDTEVICHQLED